MTTQPTNKQKEKDDYAITIMVLIYLFFKIFIGSELGVSGKIIEISLLLGGVLFLCIFKKDAHFKDIFKFKNFSLIVLAVLLIFL